MAGYTANGFWKRINKNGPIPEHRPDLGPCWQWTGRLTNEAYGRIAQSLAHRVSWELAYGDIPAGECICHACDNPSCVNPTHLFLGTNAENVADRMRKGREARGRRIWSTKLTERDVLAIRATHAAGEGPRSIARRYGLSEPNVVAILHRRTWKYI